MAKDAEVFDHLTRITRIWLTDHFLKVLDDRRRETVLAGQLQECVNLLFSDPRRPGLNLETLTTLGRVRILSARITGSCRLVLAQFAKTEVALVHFDNHDEAYAWINRNEKRLRTMVEKTREVSRGIPLASYLQSTPVVRVDVESPVAIYAAKQFRRILDDGPARYLAYLDKDQQPLVDLNMDGLLLVKGGAGTGKTAVAVHRTLALAQQPGLLGSNRILYLCFNKLLARVVMQLMRSLSGGVLPEGVEVRTFHSWCGDFLAMHDSKHEIDEDGCKQAVRRAFGKLSLEHRVVLGTRNADFVNEEIVLVIKHNGLENREEYANFDRKGRKSGLDKAARQVVWQVHEQAREYEREKGIYRYCDLPLLALAELKATAGSPEYQAIVIDEGQDCSPVMIRLARQLLSETSNQLTVFADPAQAIYECGFQWTQKELKPRPGYTRWLRRPYRTTREIYDLARPLLDGDEELRKDFHEDLSHMQAPERHGPSPKFVISEDESEAERELAERVAAEVRKRPAYQVGVIGASWNALRVLQSRLAKCGVPATLADRGIIDITEPTVKLVTLQGVKGLDFPCVFVLGPTTRDLGGVTRADSPAVRRALYVALTRASEDLTITTVDGKHHPLLELLDDQHYASVGTAARAFVNRRGMDFAVV